MAVAVQGIFSNSAPVQSAPPIKPASPQDGSSDFQSVLDQAKTPAPPKDNDAKSTDATDSSDKKVDRKEKKTAHATHGNKASPRVQKPSVKQDDPGDETTQSDAASTPLPPTVDSQELQPDAAKVVEETKTPAKGKPDLKTTPDGDAAQLAAAQDGKKVEAVKPREKKQPDSGKNSSQRTTVRAVSSADSAETNVDPQATTADASSAAQPAQATKQTPTAKGTAAKSSDKQTLAIQPRATQQGTPVLSANAPASTADGASAVDTSSAPTDSATDAAAPASPRPAAADAVNSFADLLGAAQANPHASNVGTSGIAPLPATDQPPAPTEAQFAQANHPQIVSGIHGQLLPSGGNMQLRLDPPELGALNVIVRIHDGVMTADFETSNDQATRLLSHSLSQLKTSLEAQGVSVGKLHVQQSPKNQQSDSRNDDSPSREQSRSDNPAQREQQRREMLRRMWRRLSGANDPLDLVA